MKANHTTTPCLHCGTRFKPKGDEQYCCSGCLWVAQTISEQDLARFYDLKGGKTIPPAGPEVFHEIDTEWLKQAQELAENHNSQDIAESTLAVSGISCIACVWLVEAVFKLSLIHI